MAAHYCKQGHRRYWFKGRYQCACDMNHAPTLAVRQPRKLWWEYFSEAYDRART